MVLAEDAADRCDSAELAVPPSIKPQASGSRQDCRHRAGSAWRNNKALVYVVLSQLFGTLMNVTTRLLEVDGNHGQGMHPLQVRY